MSVTSYGDISQRTAAWAAVDMLSHAEPIIVLGRYGQMKPMPKNKAEQVKFRRPIPFTVSTTPLVEGVTPASQKMRYEDVSATLNQYGGLTEITDRINDLAEDPVLSDSTELLGENAAETIELVTYGVLKAGTNVFYGAAADSARSDVNDPISIDRQRAVVKFLNRQRGKTIKKMMKAGPNYGTEPVAPAFLAFASTDCESDIRDLPGFVPSEKYAGMDVLPYEVGKCESVRYILSPLLEPFEGEGSATLNGMTAADATNVDVYPIIFIAQEAYGLIPLKGKEAIKPMVMNPDTVSKSDPLAQRGFVSWKTWFACVRLNEAWMARVEVGATDLGDPQ